MKHNLLEKTALGVSGLIALTIGASILFVPHAFYAGYGIFYAGYGIALGDDASLLSEFRAPGAGLANFGAIMLLGIWKHALQPISIASALAVFLAFPVGRLVGLALDGMPSGNVIAALVVEVAIAALLLVTSRRQFPRFAAPTRVAPHAQ